ncbi:MAG TPA: sigma-70 family RNA polymerase sigma factor [Capillimicrobium sp.]|nr:sigma-70 family RNA polymerase sigma factor [Capillimicrobium sp.]
MIRRHLLHVPSSAGMCAFRGWPAEAAPRRANHQNPAPMVPAFSEVYEEHVWDVYAFVAYRTGSRADAEDLTQLTFERALRSWHRYDPERASVRTWLLTIARNLVIDHHRSDRSGLHDELDETSATVAGPGLPAGTLDPELADALGRLSDRSREVIALRFGADLTGPEIAQMLGLSLANVQQLLSRALRRLRDELEPSRGQRSGAEH